jgi:hypothetical protein
VRAAGAQGPRSATNTVDAQQHVEQSAEERDEPDEPDPGHGRSCVALVEDRVDRYRQRNGQVERRGQKRPDVCPPVPRPVKKLCHRCLPDFAATTQNFFLRRGLAERMNQDAVRLVLQPADDHV